MPAAEEPVACHGNSRELAGENACAAETCAVSVPGSQAGRVQPERFATEPVAAVSKLFQSCSAAAVVKAFLSNPSWRDDVAEELPPEAAEDIPLDLLGHIAGLPAGATRLLWDGPEARIIEHQAHAPGHAALLIEDRGVLVAGDMLSDVLIPMLDLSTADPIGDYLAALRLLDAVADEVDVLVPIRSGDELLGARLAASVASLPSARR